MADGEVSHSEHCNIAVRLVWITSWGKPMHSLSRGIHENESVDNAREDEHVKNVAECKLLSICKTYMRKQKRPKIKPTKPATKWRRLGIDVGTRRKRKESGYARSMQKT